MAGGFGDAPKFPPTMVLEFLRRYVASPGRDAPSSGSVRSTDARDQARHMLARTAAAMAGGGMYDQLGGGFARYSVDARLGGPALREDALRQRPAARPLRPAGHRAGRPGRARDRGLPAPRSCARAEGGFASALDADSLDPATGQSVEGAFYAWTPAQLVEVLGEELTARGRPGSSGSPPEGTFEHGTSMLQLRHYPSDGPERDRIAVARRLLLAARDQRPRPGRDDKVVAAWNGLAISGLVRHRPAPR